MRRRVQSSNVLDGTKVCIARAGLCTAADRPSSVDPNPSPPFFPPQVETITPRESIPLANSAPTTTSQRKRAAVFAFFAGGGGGGGGAAAPGLGTDTGTGAHVHVVVVVVVLF